MEKIVDLLFSFHISQKDIYRVKGVKLQLNLNLENVFKLEICEDNVPHILSSNRMVLITF